MQDGAGQVLKAIELAMKVLNGEEVLETMIDFVLVTQENVDEYLNR